MILPIASEKRGKKQTRNIYGRPAKEPVGCMTQYPFGCHLCVFASGWLSADDVSDFWRINSRCVPKSPQLPCGFTGGLLTWFNPNSLDFFQTGGPNLSLHGHGNPPLYKYKNEVLEAEVILLEQFWVYCLYTFPTHKTASTKTCCHCPNKITSNQNNNINTS